MKKTTLLVIGVAAITSWLGASLLVRAQDKGAAQRCECAVIKWDGNDKVCVNLPNKSEVVHVYEMASTRPPKEMQEEEFCLAWMANKLAKDGWEPVNLDSRRLVFRRRLSP